jgi:hypothetical protein
VKIVFPRILIPEAEEVLGTPVSSCDCTFLPLYINHMPHCHVCGTLKNRSLPSMVVDCDSLTAILRSIFLTYHKYFVFLWESKIILSNLSEEKNNSIINVLYSKTTKNK